MTADFSPRRPFGVQLDTVPCGHIMVYVAESLVFWRFLSSLSDAAFDFATLLSGVY